MGSKKTTTTSSGTTTGTATTTPNLFQPAVAPLNNYYGTVNDTFTSSKPSDFVTPINGLQQGAFDAAGTLTQPNPALTEAAGMTKSMINTPAPTFNASTVTAATLPELERAALVRAGAANGYTIAGLPTAQGYTATTASPVDLAEMARQAQAQSVLDNFSNYYNPATGALVDTTLSGFDDNAARQRAQMEAEAAKGGAFGGSRYGIQVAQTVSDLARQRAATEAQLRANAWNAAAGLAQYDTSNRQQAQLFNVGAQNARDENIAQMNMANNQFNAGQSNNAAQFLAGAQNDFGLAGFNAENAARQFQADAQNRFSLADAAAANQLNMFNAGQFNEFGMQGAQMQQQANMANAQAAQEAAQANAQMQLQQQAQNLGAVNQYADIASQAQQNALTGINAQLAAGNTLYGLQDAATQAPISYLQNYGSLLNPQLINTASGQTVNTIGTTNETGTTKQSGGLLNSLLSAGAQLGSAAIMASERRVKRDIELLGREADGLGVYNFRYIWDADNAPLHTGVMVDEVEKLRPWALGPVVDGIQTVNYGEL